MLTAASACGRSAPAGSAPPAASRVAEGANSVGRSEDAEDTTGAPAHIFYELTLYEWYRHGQPLLVDGTPYQPAGAPVRLRSSELEPLGTYEGVDYYRNSHSPDLVFVPVYPGYWQPFAPTGAHSSTTAE